MALSVLVASPARALVAPVLSVGTVTDTSIQVNWTDAGDEQKYIVYRGTSPTNLVQIQTLFATIHTYTHTGLTPGVNYFLRVDAKKGGTTLQSNVVQQATLPPPTGSCTEPNVDIDSSMSTITIQNFIDASNSQFCFASGTYHLTAKLLLGTNDDLICNLSRQCILTGDDTYLGAIKGPPSGTVTDNVVRGFVIEHFANVFSDAANRSALTMGWGGQIIDVEVRNNTSVGVGVADGNVIRDSFVHNNTVVGILTGPCNQPPATTTTLVENNEVSFNGNTADVHRESGGIVVKGSSGCYGYTARGNNVHDNIGTGIWLDGLTVGATIDNNDSFNNQVEGIDVEISENNIVSNNRVHDNQLAEPGLGETASCYNGEIVIYESSGNQVFGNTVTDSRGENGICVVPFLTRHSGDNNSVHDNSIYMRVAVGQTVGPFTGSVSSDPAHNNTFENNHYFVDTNCTTVTRWQWGGAVTWPSWQSFGNDDTGSCTVW
jgi:parallel beta-helix repeat protein